MRAGILCSAAALALAPCWLRTAAAAQGAPDVVIEVIVVSASGRGTRPQFDPKIPPKLRKQLEGAHLAYSRYMLVGIQRRPARFGADTLFALPRKEALTVTATKHAAAAYPLRITYQVFDAKRTRIQRVAMLCRYGQMFLIHIPKGPDAFILGVAAHKPPS